MMTLSTNNSLNAAAATANSGTKIKAPTGVKTTVDAANETLTAKAASGMGQKDFLTLFTTQLKCQDPLDPVKNEAFVAQLAQFSQLEATTTMAETLKTFVDSMSGERMMSSTNMIGKTVAVQCSCRVCSGQARSRIDTTASRCEWRATSSDQRQRSSGCYPNFGSPTNRRHAFVLGWQ